MTNPSRALAVRDMPSSLPDKIEYAKYLAEAKLLPYEYRKNPADVLFAMEYGQALGIHASVAMMGVHVIEGKPGASPALMSALVRRAGHRLRVWLDRTTMTAYAELTRADDPDFTFRAEWDLDRAVTATLCTIKDGKAYARSDKGKPLSWEKYPGNMLKWRCVAEVCRDGAEECLMGMHYTPEELGAEVDAQGEPLRVTAERVTQPAPESRTPRETPAAPANGARPTTRATRPTPSPSATPAPAPAEEKASEPVTVVDGEVVPDTNTTDWDGIIAECRERLDLDSARDLWHLSKAQDPGETGIPMRERIGAVMAEIKEALETQTTTGTETTVAADESTDTVLAPEDWIATKSRDGLRRHLFGILGEGGITDTTVGREQRLLILSRLLNKVPALTSSDDLSDLEMAQAITALLRHQREDRLTETLQSMLGVSA